MAKHGQKGGLHPVDCNCGKAGCWSNKRWLKLRVERAIKEGKPLPDSWPEKYRNLVILDGSGKTVAESKSGEVPSMSEQVEGVLQRKKLPLVSEVQKQTVFTDQVPLRVNIPFRVIAKGINVAQKGAEPPAPAEAMMDDSQEQENILNEYFQRAFPDVMVSPKLAFVVALVFWFIPPAFYWIPRWMKTKLKGFKWPWSKKTQPKSHS